MGWDRTWGFKKRKLKLTDIQQAATTVAGGYAGVAVTVEKESEDCITCFFSVPKEAGLAEQYRLEISIYNMGSDGHVLSLEADAEDNSTTWDDASQLAEDLAEMLEAQPLDL